MEPLENRKTAEVNLIEAVPDHIDAEIDITHLQPSQRKSALRRFREFLESIDRSEDLKHLVRNRKPNPPHVQRTVSCVRFHGKSNIHH